MSDTRETVRQVAETYFGTELTEELLDGFELIDVAGGDWLFRQGDDGRSLFLAVRGRLLVLSEGDDPSDPKLLGEVVPGESVGEVGLLTGEKRSAGIRAIRDSLLIRINRQTFDEMSGKHPELIMKLAANVANMLRRSVPASARPQFNTIALVPLSGTDKITRFSDNLSRSLDGFGQSITLKADTLLECGAPAVPNDADNTIPESLKHWLHQQETQNRFLVYICEADDKAWTRFAMRQSDLVVFIADSQEDQALSEWETRLRTGKGTATGRQALVLLQPPSENGISGTAQWLKNRQPDYHFHVREDKPDDTERVARIISGNAIGLVLSGGAARGFAHLGVYKALLELGISIDWVGGASIGSVFGSPIASDWDYERAYQVTKNSFVKVKPFSDYTLPLAGLIRGGRMERELKTHQDYNIEDLPTPYFCVSSLLDSGELQMHEHGLLANALRASASLPGVLPPAVVNKRLTIDGAVLNCMPVDIMKQKPVGKIIAVDLTPNKTYEVDYAAIPSPWAILAGRYLPFFRKYRVPSLATTILKATEIGTLEKVQQSGQLADLLLRPPVRQYGITDMKAFDRIVDAGYEHAKSELEKWQTGLVNKQNQS